VNFLNFGNFGNVWGGGGSRKFARRGGDGPGPAAVAGAVFVEADALGAAGGVEGVAGDADGEGLALQLGAARARGRVRGRPQALDPMTVARLLERNADPNNDIEATCETMRISRSTLSRDVEPGALVNTRTLKRETRPDQGRGT
jgi:hypothetical protein